MHGNIWISELDNNPSVAILGFEGGDGSTTQVALTKDGVEATVGLLLEWLEYNEEQMNDLINELSFMEQTDEEG